MLGAGLRQKREIILLKGQSCTCELALSMVIPCREEFSKVTLKLHPLLLPINEPMDVSNARLPCR